MKIIFATLIFIFNTTFASNSFEQIVNDYAIRWHRLQYVYVTTITKNDKVLFETLGGYVSDKFLRFTPYEHYFVLVWRKGVHGERVVVFNTKTNLIDWDYNSNWPVKDELENSTLRIHYSDQIEKTQINLIKEFSLDTF